MVGVLGLGFAIGVGLLVVGQLQSRGGGPVEIRNRFATGGVSVLPTPTRERPELWQTPIASLVFPEGDPLEANGARSVVTATYDPRGPRIVPLPPIRDAIGRPTVAAVVALTHEDDLRTPDPLRPSTSEPTALTVTASTADGQAPTGCVFVMNEAVLRAKAAFGAANVEGCGRGLAQLPGGAAVAFVLRYDQLPNNRTRDGAWREGAVIGRTEIRAGLTDAPAQ